MKQLNTVKNEKLWRICYDIVDDVIILALRRKQRLRNIKKN